MNLLDKNVQHFIKEYKGATTDLLLKKTVFNGISNKELVQQIEGRRTAGKKLPFLLVKENVLFPPTLNLEQTSSEATAQYKAQNLQGERFLDLTCGFGIDAFFLSEKFKEVTLVEENEELLSKVKHKLAGIRAQGNLYKWKRRSFFESNNRTLQPYLS